MYYIKVQVQYSSGPASLVDLDGFEQEFTECTCEPCVPVMDLQFFDILFDFLSLDFVKRHLFGICPIRDQMSLTLAF